MDKEYWLSCLKRAYESFQGMNLTDKDCKELYDLLSRGNKGKR